MPRRVGTLAFIAAVLPAQDEPTLIAPEVLRERFAKTGRLVATQYQRAEDGVLEIWCLGDNGDASEPSFHPIVGRLTGTTRALHPENLGLLGLLALVCHGDADLLAMTDAEAHFAALGVAADDVGLRQLLAMPLTAASSSYRDAEVLDRLLAIDRLQHRRARGAVGELTALANDVTISAVLRERAKQALTALRGEAVATARATLRAESLRLPPAFDACVVIDHAKLPDLRFLTKLSRVLGMNVTVEAITAANTEMPESSLLSAQRFSDAAGEAPFWCAHTHGNLRIDQSCIVINANTSGIGDKLLAVTWQAAGEFGAAAWQDADWATLKGDLGIPAATGSMTTQEIWVSSDGGERRPRPQLAEPLLTATGAAVRAILPANSNLWVVMAWVGLPRATGAELRILFSDPATIELRVAARDEDVVETWLSRGKEALQRLVERQRALPTAEQLDIEPLLLAVMNTKCEVRDATACATITVAGITTAYRDRLLGLFARIVH
jgi:hypothetical protein